MYSLFSKLLKCVVVPSFIQNFIFGIKVWNNGIANSLVFTSVNYVPWYEGFIKLYGDKFFKSFRRSKEICLFIRLVIFSSEQFNVQIALVLFII